MNENKEETPMTKKTPGKHKAEIFQAMLERSPSVFVHVAGKEIGVSVPEHLKGQTQIVMVFGKNLPVPIPDLEWDERGVSGTLSFKGKPFWCYIPWDCVFSLIMADQRGMMFHEAMPEELREDCKKIDEAEKAGVVSILCAKERKPIIIRRKEDRPARPDYLKVVTNTP